MSRPYILVYGRNGAEIDSHEAGAIESKHSTEVESSPPPPHFCTSIHPDGEPCTDLVRVLVLNDPPARW